MVIPTYTDMTDGELVSNFATNLNTFGNGVVDTLGIIDTALTTLDTNKLSAIDQGLLYLVNVSPVSASLTTAYTKVDMVDTIQIDESNAHVSYSIANKEVTFVSAGIYKLTFSGSMTANNGAIITFDYNLNGVSIVANPPQFIGAGVSNAVAIESHAVISVTANSILYVEAKADSAVTMTPQSCSFIIEKTQY